jgi:hypothetical protein
LQETNGITTNSRAPAYIYAPANAAPVGKFYKTCVATCAIGDGLSADGTHCKVRDPDALAFFGAGNDRCLNRGPGVNAISNTQVSFVSCSSHLSLIGLFCLNAISNTGRRVLLPQEDGPSCRGLVSHLQALRTLKPFRFLGQPWRLNASQRQSSLL